MNTLFFFGVFILGTIIGSFLNVVILRFGTGRTVLGRSGCFSCGKTLSPSELVPIVSYLAQRGRCKQCGAKISSQYVLVEVLTGFIFLFLFVRILGGWEFDFITISLFLASLILWSFLILIGVYDFKHKAIPTLFSFGFILSAVAVTFIQSLVDFVWKDHLIAAFVLSGFFSFLWVLTRGRAMGFGDCILAFGIGLYLGLAQGISAIAFAFWIGAVFGVSKMFLGRVGTKRLREGEQTLTMKSEVPFAPFLILGTFLALAFQSDIFHIAFFLNA